jgi:hypothetical protein
MKAILIRSFTKTTWIRTEGTSGLKPLPKESKEFWKSQLTCSIKSIAHLVERRPLTIFAAGDEKFLDWHLLPL